MRTYLARALKYIVKLAALIALLFAAMILTRTTDVAAGDLMSELFGSTRGLLLIGVLLVVAGLYPLFGFIRRDVKGSFGDNKSAIRNAMEASGYRLADDDGSVMTFKADSVLKRILKLWDDEIRIYGDDHLIIMEGSRKEVVQAQYRLRAIIGQQ